MNDFVKRPDAAAATPRGNIQRGETGDKIPGFDPAAAPLETDAEAGAVTPAAATGPDPAGPADADPLQNLPSDGDAMRRFDEAPPSGRGMMATVLIVLGLALLLIAVLLAR